MANPSERMYRVTTIGYSDEGGRMADRVRALDGWRAISAGLVIASHIQRFSSVRFDFPLSNYGTLGVEYFFGISGFVIARGLLSAGGGGFRQFYMRRVFRIMPPLLMYLAVLTVLVLTQVVPSSALNAARGLIFACNLPWSNCGGWFGGHLWSLSVEEQFYLVCPFVILVTRSRWLITAAMAAVPMLALGLRFGHMSDAGGFVTNFAVIAVGVLCAANEDAILAIIARVPVWTAFLGFAATIGLMEVKVTVLTSLLQNLALGPLVMFVLLRTSVGGGAVTTALSAGWITTLGAATYTIYLFQELATYAYPGAGPWFYAVSVGACIAWGLVSLQFVERPLIDFGRSLARSIHQTSVFAADDRSPDNEQVGQLAGESEPA